MENAYAIKAGTVLNVIKKTAIVDHMATAKIGNAYATLVLKARNVSIKNVIMNA